MNRIVLIVLLIPSLAIIAQPTISWTDPVSVSTEEYGAKKNSIALSTDGNPIVLHGSSSGAPGLYISIMSDNVFGLPIQVTPDTDIYLSEAEGPIMAVEGEQIAVSYQVASDWDAGSRVVLSDDGGISWSEPYVLNPGASEYTLVESISFGPDGLPFVGLKWGDNSTVQGIQLYDEATDTFLPPVNGSDEMDGDEVCECCPSNTFSHNDRYYNVVRNNNDNIRDMWLNVSDDGSIWSDALDIDPTNWYINSCPATGASSTVMEDGTMVTSFMSGVNGSRVFWSSVDLVNLQITGFSQLDPSATNIENFPSITSYGEWLIVAWERNSAGYDVMMSLSDAGANMLENSVVDITDVIESLSGHNRNPSVVYDGEFVHLTFRNTGENIVKYMRGTISGTSKVEAEDEPQRQVQWLLSNQLENWLLSGIHGNANYVLYDALGKMVESGKFENALLLPVKSGFHFLQVTQDGVTKTFTLL